ncbi:MAG: ATP synthase F0 subunit B [Pseudomonadota bacterium]
MGMLQSVLSQIGIDRTFFYQLFLVICVYFVLSKFLFRPILKIMLIRRDKTEGLKKNANSILLESDRLKNEYDAVWSGYVKQANSEKQKIYAEANKKVSDIIKDSEQKSSVYIEGGREQIQQDVLAVQKQLGAYSDEIKSRIKVKLAGN